MITKKEAITYFKRHLDLYCVDGISREAEEMAIKALEQESVFDKIRAEIEQDIAEANNLLKDEHDERVFGCICGYEEALKIIDKYKEESEDKE